MNFLANENVFQPIVEFLRSEGHEVLDFKRTALAGAPDDAVYERAVRDGLVVVTMDKDFTRMVRFPPNRCGGIIVAKLYRMKLDETTELFKKLFRTLSEDAIRGRLVVMTREGVRFRTAPGRVG